jgi:hypothetical protein
MKRAAHTVTTVLYRVMALANVEHCNSKELGEPVIQEEKHGFSQPVGLFPEVMIGRALT